MVRFLDLLRKVNVNVPFLKVLKEVPSYLTFLRGLLSKKAEPKGVSVIPIKEVCSTILLSMSPSKL